MLNKKITNYNNNPAYMFEASIIIYFSS